MPTSPSLPAKRSPRRPRIGSKVVKLGPLGEASWRLQVLEAAGVTLAQAAEDVRMMVTSWRDCIRGAMSPLAPENPDWHARNAAAKALGDFYGLKAPRSTGSDDGNSQVAVTINMPDWSSIPQPKPARVIEVQPIADTGQEPNPD